MPADAPCSSTTFTRHKALNGRASTLLADDGMMSHAGDLVAVERILFMEALHNDCLEHLTLLTKNVRTKPSPKRGNSGHTPLNHLSYCLKLVVERFLCVSSPNLEAPAQPMVINEWGPKRDGLARAVLMLVSSAPAPTALGTLRCHRRGGARLCRRRRSCSHSRHPRWSYRWR